MVAMVANAAIYVRNGLFMDLQGANWFRKLNTRACKSERRKLSSNYEGTQGNICFMGENL